MEVIRIPLSDVRPNIEGRVINRKSVETLAESMNRIGLINPITVVPCVYTARGRADNPGWRVVAGGHRTEAARMLGWEAIDAFVLADCDDVKSQRMVEISENLHRAELSDVEKSKLIEEWRELTCDKVRQLGAPLGGGQPKEQGFRKTANELGLKEQEVRRAHKIANMAPEAQDAARDLGLDSNQSALLAAAKQNTPEAQIESLRQHAERKMKFAPPPLNEFEAREAWTETGMKWWNRGSSEWRDYFWERIGVR